MARHEIKPPVSPSDWYTNDYDLGSGKRTLEVMSMIEEPPVLYYLFLLGTR